LQTPSYHAPVRSEPYNLEFIATARSRELWRAPARLVDQHT